MKYCHSLCIILFENENGIHCPDCRRRTNRWAASVACTAVRCGAHSTRCSSSRNIFTIEFWIFVSNVQTASESRTEDVRRWVTPKRFRCRLRLFINSYKKRKQEIRVADSDLFTFVFWANSQNVIDISTHSNFDSSRWVSSSFAHCQIMLMSSSVHRTKPNLNAWQSGAARLLWRSEKCVWTKQIANTQIDMNVLVLSGVGVCTKKWLLFIIYSYRPFILPLSFIGP